MPTSTTTADGHVRAAGGYGQGMTTTPQEPSPAPDVVPSGDPDPISTPSPEPGEDPGVAPAPEVDPDQSG